MHRFLFVETVEAPQMQIIWLMIFYTEYLPKTD